MAQAKQLTNKPNSKQQLWLRGVVGPLAMFGLLFLSAGRWDYWQGWLYQLDRGQIVCQAGPYRYVRHPGYVGGILFALAMPLMLGSLWALLPQVFAVLLLVWRTALEDRTLQAELPGYVGYGQTTRYRLLPGLW